MHDSKLLRYLLLPLTLLTLSNTPAQAQAVISSIPYLESIGYAHMDDINTTLLHHVATGVSYDLRALAEGEPGSWVPRPEDDVRKKSRHQNEFIRHEAEAEWQAFIDSRINTMKSARGYLIPLETRWNEYDFKTARYAASLQLVKEKLHCAGAYQYDKNRKFLTSCMAITPMGPGLGKTNSFPMDEQLARAVKNNPGRYRVYAVAEPHGSFNVIKDKKISYPPFFRTYTVSGVQPVSIVNMLLVNTSHGEIHALALPEPRLLTSNLEATQNKPAASGKPNVSAPQSLIRTRWMRYASNNYASFYMDFDSIRRKDNEVTVKDMADFTSAESDGSTSTLGTYVYHCANRTVARQNLARYRGHHAQGEAMDTAPTLPSVDNVPAGSIMEIAMNILCNQPLPANPPP